MRETTGTDVLAAALLLAGIGTPEAIGWLLFAIVVGTPLYVAGMVLRAWRFHRRGVARLRKYEARLGR